METLLYWFYTLAGIFGIVSSFAMSNNKYATWEALLGLFVLILTQRLQWQEMGDTNETN